MNLVEHEKRDDMKVWLSEDELGQLIDQPADAEKEMAFSLAGRCGLRSHEVLQVAPQHVHNTDAGTMLAVEEGKGDKYRETPMPDTLAGQIRTAGKYGGGENEPVVTPTTTRTLRQWINQAGRELAEQTDNHRWEYLSMHDLRRTWATTLRDKGVDPMIVLRWGGWNDLETFKEHYAGAYSPEAQRREREKVDWL